MSFTGSAYNYHDQESSSESDDEILMKYKQNTQSQTQKASSLRSGKSGRSHRSERSHKLPSVVPAREYCFLILYKSLGQLNIPVHSWIPLGSRWDQCRIHIRCHMSTNFLFWFCCQDVVLNKPGLCYFMASGVMGVLHCAILDTGSANMVDKTSHLWWCGASFELNHHSQK